MSAFVVFAYAGNIVATLALLFGLSLWPVLSAPQRTMAVFCGAAAVCGFGQALWYALGWSTAFWGNLSDISLLGGALPAIWMRLRRRRRPVVRFLGAVGVAIWFTAIVLEGDLGHFAFSMSALIYACVAVSAAILVQQFATDCTEPLRNPAFIRGLALMVACLADAMVTPHLGDPDAGYSVFVRQAFTLRNLLWVAVYGAFLYSTFLHEREPRKAVEPHESGHRDGLAHLSIG